VSNVASFY